MQEKLVKCLVIEGFLGNYFNVGVVYLQFEVWVKNDFMNKVIVMLVSDLQYMKYKCFDQDILNILFFGYCIFISGDYDCFYGIDYELENKSDEDYKKIIIDDIKLIYYVGVMKFWNDWMNYFCQKYFNEVYQVFCWNDVVFILVMNEKQY